MATATQLAKSIDPIEISKACHIPAVKIREKLTEQMGQEEVSFAKAVVPSPPEPKEVIEVKTPSGIIIKVYT